MTLDPAFVYGNYAESALWATMGAIALFKRPNRWAVGLGVTLIAFGCSDVVEAHTGAWYDPWWLFTWKAVGVLLIVALGVAAMKRSRTKPKIVLPPMGHDEHR